jgi:hypothetical protein
VKLACLYIPSQMCTDQVQINKHHVTAGLAHFLSFVIPDPDHTKHADPDHKWYPDPAQTRQADPDQTSYPDPAHKSYPIPLIKAT